VLSPQFPHLVLYLEGAELKDPEIKTVQNSKQCSKHYFSEYYT